MCFYQSDVLEKLAGFEGLEPQALEQLISVLCVYRSLSEKYRANNADEDRSAFEDDDLLGLADRLLDRRRELARLLQEGPVADGEPASEAERAFARLEPLGEELELLARLDGIFEELAMRELLRPEACAETPAGPESLLWRMLQHAALSGVDLLENDGLEALQSGCLHGPALRKVLSAISASLKRSRETRRTWLAPHVKQSIRRLWNHPLAQPSESFTPWWKAWKDRPETIAAEELLELLADDLAAADGGLLLLEDFVQRMQHVSE